MEKHTSSIGGAIFNFINSIIGSGIIGIPLALHQAGFASGVLLLGVVAVITDYTVLLLIKDGLISGKFSYQEMVTKAFRTPGYIFLTVAQLLFPFFGESWCYHPFCICVDHFNGYIDAMCRSIYRIISWVQISRNRLDQAFGGFNVAKNAKIPSRNIRYILTYS